jgi:hypothetical protein
VPICIDILLVYVLPTHHSQVLLNIFIGVQILRMFAFRELIQNATHGRAAIRFSHFTGSVQEKAVAAKEVEHKLEDASLAK